MKKNLTILATLSLALVLSLGIVPNNGIDGKFSPTTIKQNTDNPRG